MYSSFTHFKAEVKRVDDRIKSPYRVLLWFFRSRQRAEVYIHTKERKKKSIPPVYHHKTVFKTCTFWVIPPNHRDFYAQERVFILP